ncbi:MAG: diaminopimelate epimerase [Ectothiorhodospiraceae bacterium]|nr:diaminopimelate epimerase [Chromatiales bacterium]MCP5154565.1 diaminopimelate epimerase [Ectothiorhodospiraceae bacterium]
MNEIPFVKYTSFGNNFVIVDELDRRWFPGDGASDFAFEATDGCFGVGADNLLVVQRADAARLEAIRAERGYWSRVPALDGADFLFRMFEPDGVEAYCCGNGLMCIAHHLWEAHGITSSSLATELPLTSPRLVRIGVTEGGGGAWADMGQPRPMPGELYTGPLEAGDPQRIRGLEITFRSHDLKPYTDETVLRFDAYAVFTGEPHLVVFPDESFSVPELAHLFFVGHGGGAAAQDKRASQGTWLLERIGAYLNTHYPTLFPHGINLNLVRVDPATETVEYRCFERGLDRETLACGTGAMAVAHAVRALGRCARNPIAIVPHRARWFDTRATLGVRADPRGWVLSGSPRRLFRGTFARRGVSVDATPEAAHVGHRADSAARVA